MTKKELLELSRIQLQRRRSNLQEKLKTDISDNIRKILEREIRQIDPIAKKMTINAHKKRRDETTARNNNKELVAGLTNYYGVYNGHITKACSSYNGALGAREKLIKKVLEGVFK